MFDTRKFIEEKNLDALTEEEKREISFQFKTKGHHLKRVKAAILKFGLDRKRVIDIGCGVGGCLINFGNGSVGIERAPAKIKLCKAIGLKVIDLDLNDAIEIPLEDEDYDVIWASDILEHFHSPWKVLVKTRGKIKPEGLLVVYITKIPPGTLCKTFWKKVFGLEGYMADAHLYQWTHETACFLIEKAGFRIIDRYITPTGITSVDWFLGKLFLRYWPSCTIVGIKEEK